MRKSTPFYIKVLIKALGLLETNQKLSFHPNYFLKQSFRDYARKREKYYQAFFYLLRYKFLEKRLIKNVESFAVTRKGRFKSIKYFLKNKQKEKWDGLWRVVVFDIPEEKYHLRNRFRENLQLAGFKYIQKSTWACPYNREKELRIIVDYLDLHQYVKFMAVKHFDDDEGIRKLFNL